MPTSAYIKFRFIMANTLTSGNALSIQVPKTHTQRKVIHTYTTAISIYTFCRVVPQLRPQAAHAEGATAHPPMAVSLKSGESRLPT